MRVRDKSLDVSEYKGRVTDASMRICPCMPCYIAHDCGRYQYTGQNTRKWKVDMVCVTRHNDGCPSPEPEPRHLYVSDRGTICKRCGFTRTLDHLKAMNELRQLANQFGHVPSEVWPKFLIDKVGKLDEIVMEAERHELVGKEVS